MEGLTVEGAEKVEGRSVCVLVVQACTVDGGGEVEGPTVEGGGQVEGPTVEGGGQVQGCTVKGGGVLGGETQGLSVCVGVVQ